MKRAMLSHKTLLIVKICRLHIYSNSVRIEEFIGFSKFYWAWKEKRWGKMLRGIRPWGHQISAHFSLLKPAANVIASSGVWTREGIRLQPGLLTRVSSCRIVLLSMDGVTRSSLDTTIKKGTPKAMASPTCSRVVPTEKKQYLAVFDFQWRKHGLSHTSNRLPN